jgi:hypothetical protein
MRKTCLALPDTLRSRAVRAPGLARGKKVFAHAHCYDGSWRAVFWVGVDQQGLMTQDARFSIPPYMGHMGWIALDVSKSHNDAELRALALESYRHYAIEEDARRRSRPDDRSLGAPNTFRVCRRANPTITIPARSDADVSQLIERGRAHFERREWNDAFSVLSAADDATPLGPRTSTSCMVRGSHGP